LRLSREGHQVVVVDRNPEKVREVSEQMDVQTLVASGSSPKALHKAGVEQADMVVAVTDSDEVNMVACLYANLIAPSATRVARIRGADYLNMPEAFEPHLLGVGTVINPEQEVAAQIQKFLSVPAASSVADFCEGRIKLLGLKIPASSPLVGRKMAEAHPAGGPAFLVAAIERQGETIIPQGDDVLLAEDLAYISVRESEASALLAHFGLRNEPVRNLVIVGGGTMGQLAAEVAHNLGIKTRIIEKKPERCQELVDQLKGVMVLQGDGTDLTVLREENVGAADVFAALTDDEEDNVLIALLGKKMGANRTVTRVAHLGYVPLVNSLGLDLVVSPRFAAVGAILRYLRRGKVLSIASLKSGGAEVIEVEALETSGVVGKPLVHVKMPRGALVSALSRNGQVEIPTGNTVVLPGDRLVIFLLADVWRKVEKLLTVRLEYF
jgi:trk system potassium uptake protein TrkA